MSAPTFYNLLQMLMQAKVSAKNAAAIPRTTMSKTCYSLLVAYPLRERFLGYCIVERGAALAVMDSEARRLEFHEEDGPGPHRNSRRRRGLVYRKLIGKIAPAQARNGKAPACRVERTGQGLGYLSMDAAIDKTVGITP